MKKIYDCCKNKGSLSSEYKNPLSATAELSASSGRTALCTLRGCQGSLTLEAAMVLPVFLFLILSCVFLMEVFLIHTEVQGGIFQAARNIASNVTLLSCEEGSGILGSEAGANAYCMMAARSKTLECIEDKLDDKVSLKGGKESLQFLHSKIQDNVVDVIVTYTLKLPYSFGIDISFPVVQRCQMRIWNGVKTGSRQLEEMVYITKMGGVYHQSRECTHIQLDIRSISIEQITVERNNNGAKYYPCEKCGAAGEKKQVYVTGDGTKYHTSLNCSGLKRFVLRVGISKVGNRRPCSRCCR